MRKSLCTTWWSTTVLQLFSGAIDIETMARVCEHDFKHRRASTALSPARKVKSQKHGEPRAPLTSHATCANDNQCNAFTPCLFYSIFDPDPLRQNSVHSAVEIRTGIDINVSIAVARHVAQHQLNHSCASSIFQHNVFSPLAQCAAPGIGASRSAMHRSSTSA